MSRCLFSAPRKVTWSQRVPCASPVASEQFSPCYVCPGLEARGCGRGAGKKGELRACQFSWVVISPLVLPAGPCYCHSFTVAFSHHSSCKAGSYPRPPPPGLLERREHTWAPSSVGCPDPLPGHSSQVTSPLPWGLVPVFPLASDLRSLSSPGRPLALAQPQPLGGGPLSGYQPPPRKPASGF